MLHSKCYNKSEDKTIKSMKVTANRTKARIVAGSNSEDFFFFLNDGRFYYIKKRRRFKDLLVKKHLR